MKNLMILVTMLFISCANSDDAITTTCYKDENRKVVAIFENAKGRILAPNSNSCTNIFVLKYESDDYLLPFGPCNLTEAFKVDELEVLFSGYLFESYDEEDLCAFPFELTKISRIEPIN